MGKGGRRIKLMNIIPIFPTPIGQVFNFITNDERIELIKSIKDTKHVEHNAIKGDGSSTFYTSFKGLNKNIKNRLEQQVNDYAKTYGMKPNLKIINIWSNIQNDGSVLEEHYHPGSYVSGALYINVDDSCSISFHNPNPYIYFTRFEDKTSFNYEWQSFLVNNGDLILFPSWLKHGNHKDINRMNGRMVISFNTYKYSYNSVTDNEDF